jgi:hypothetical protein
MYSIAAGSATRPDEFIYDAFDRLIRRTVDPDGATGSTALVDTFFSWEADQINLIFGGDDVGDLSNRLLYGPEGKKGISPISDSDRFFITLRSNSCASRPAITRAR